MAGLRNILFCFQGSQRHDSNLRNAMRAHRIVLAPVLALLAACGSPQERPSLKAVTIGTVVPWPAAVTVAQDDPPRVLAAQLSSDVIHVGDWWSGKVATTTNVAVVEFRSPSFSFIFHRSAFGQFAFRTHVLAVPSIYRRGFEATLVARGAGKGLVDARTVQLVFR